MTTLQITRPSEWQNRIRKYKVYIDNEQVGILSNGETKDFFPTEGAHTIHVKMGWYGSAPYHCNLNKEDIQYLKVSSSAMAKWLPFSLIPFVLLHVFFKDVIGEGLSLLFFIPVLLIVIYLLTLGRNKYLTLTAF
ncbi:hypothetical protein F0919_09670 [Taibaiella lutea]|uniref:PEGA domain-containing protein n=1 Tax=Taibaiella lutea TaxID=2608001 RepID=A0A5M6CI25_9BACT|nr:hypothetical protein [Taibaiella lutea]KAA5534861.1 hypothetical protein F0919_09670 [Taibaiella lutea]